MLNTNVNNRVNISMNQAVSGTIQKSHFKSVMKRFHENSKMAEYLFDKCQLDDGYKSDRYIILQMMLSNDGYILAEIVKEEDFKLTEISNKPEIKPIEVNQFTKIGLPLTTTLDEPEN